MSWTWTYTDAENEPVTGADPAPESFPSQSDAESWIGEVWQQLLEQGVDGVTLLEDARVVYGPMSLRPPE